MSNAQAMMVQCAGESKSTMVIWRLSVDVGESASCPANFKEYSVCRCLTKRRGVRATSPCMGAGEGLVAWSLSPEVFNFG